MGSERQLIRSLGACALVLLPLALGACDQAPKSNSQTTLAVMPEAQSGASDTITDAQLTLIQELKFRLETQLKFPESTLGGHAEVNPARFYLTNIAARPAVKALPNEMLREMGPDVFPETMVVMRLDRLSIATSSGPEPINTSLILRFKSPAQARTFMDGIRRINSSIDVLQSLRTPNGKQTIDAETVLRITRTFSDLLLDTPFEATTIVMQKPLEPLISGQAPTNSMQLTAAGHQDLLNQAWTPLVSRATLSHPEATTLVPAGDLVRVVDIGGKRYFFMRPVGTTLDTVLAANRGVTIAPEALADLALPSLKPIKLPSGTYYPVKDFGLTAEQIAVADDKTLLSVNPYMTLVKADAEATRSGSSLYMETARIAALVRRSERIQTATGIATRDHFGTDPIQQDIVKSLQARNLIPGKLKAAASNMFLAANIIPMAVMLSAKPIAAAWDGFDPRFNTSGSSLTDKHTFDGTNFWERLSIGTQIASGDMLVPDNVCLAALLPSHDFVWSLRSISDKEYKNFAYLTPVQTDFGLTAKVCGLDLQLKKIDPLLVDPNYVAVSLKTHEQGITNLYYVNRDTGETIPYYPPNFKESSFKPDEEISLRLPRDGKLVVQFVKDNGQVIQLAAGQVPKDTYFVQPGDATNGIAGQDAIFISLLGTRS